METDILVTVSLATIILITNTTLTINLVTIILVTLIRETIIFVTVTPKRMYSRHPVQWAGGKEKEVANKIISSSILVIKFYMEITSYKSLTCIIKRAPGSCQLALLTYIVQN